jgi:penicillin-binding protein 1B
VGFDDNRELKLEGAHSAAPIWAEFMKAASQVREYRDTKEFPAPDGIVSTDIDPASGMPATAMCPTRRAEVYISGTQPVGMCPLHGGGRPVTHVAGWDVAPPPQPQPAGDTTPRVTGSDGDGQAAPPVARRAARQDIPPASPSAQASANPPEPPKKEEKKGFFRRLIGVFK